MAMVSAILKNVPLLDSGARGSTTTFVERHIGDVLIAWESEALLLVARAGSPAARAVEIVRPDESIACEPVVAVVDRYAEAHGTRKIAEAYVQFLYTEEAQMIVARHHFRPRSREALELHRQDFPDIRLYEIDEAFGGWAQAQRRHFDEGGTFDDNYRHAEARGP
jgi:sulfate transport system substrate-binding protein